VDEPEAFRDFVSAIEHVTEHYQVSVAPIPTQVLIDYTGVPKEVYQGFIFTMEVAYREDPRDILEHVGLDYGR
jgi:hypothetical protein